MADLSVFERIHLVGVGGSGMSGIAKLLGRMGFRVTGSDLRSGGDVASLADSGVVTWMGHRPQLAGEWDLVAASSAVPANDPELAAAATRGIPVWTRAQLLEAMTSPSPAIGVAGTHGKSTTTALVVGALQALGLDPSFLVGATLLDWGTNAHLGDPNLLVLEADEAYRTFELLHLRGLVVTNIEAEHLVHYGSVDQLEASFRQVAERVAGPVVVCADDAGSDRLAEAAGAITYGTAADARWRLDDIKSELGGVSFRLVGPAGWVPVRVPRPGLHVARNAAGALALLGELGMDVAKAAIGISEFGGLGRRYQLRGRISGVTIIDDYAHHPSEVAATIAAAREQLASRLWAVFQPHRYSRTFEMGTQFGPALAGADRVVVTDVFAAGEEPIPGVSGRLVADAVRAEGTAVEYIPRRRQVAGYLAPQLREGDLVLTMGAGDVGSIGEELLLELGGGKS